MVITCAETVEACRLFARLKTLMFGLGDSSQWPLLAVHSIQRSTPVHCSGMFCPVAISTLAQTRCPWGIRMWNDASLK